MGEARAPKKRAEQARKLRGIKAKITNKERFKEKVQMKKTIKAHQEKKTKQSAEAPADKGAVPAYLMDREQQSQAKVISNMVKQKRKEKVASGRCPYPLSGPSLSLKCSKCSNLGKLGEKGGKGWLPRSPLLGTTSPENRPSLRGLSGLWV